MKKKIRLFVLVFLIMIVAFACYEPYKSSGVDNNASYLVVDAFVNSTDSSATVTLSHTVPLNSIDTISHVNDATVKLEDDSGTSTTLSFTNDGVYTVRKLNVQLDKKYKIVIASGGETYESELIQVQQTPPIDTVSWSINRNNLDINISTHDPLGASRFYRWKFVETWQYMSPVPTNYIVKNDSVVVRTKDENIATCWRTLNANKIILCNTTDLTSDVVSNFNIQSIPSNSIKLSTKYTILVKQQTLSKDAYTYWLNIKKTTESLGSIFDPLPGAVSGNIKCITNPDERIIGFFSAGSVSEKRIYIKRSDLNSFVNYKYPSCMTDTIICDTAHVRNGWYAVNPRIHFQNADEVVGQVNDKSGSVIIGYVITLPVCTDCRQLDEGNTIEPAFWKD